MPTSKAATKALRQSQRKASRNRHFTALYKESIKKIAPVVAAHDNTEKRIELLSEIYSSIDTLVKKNILHPNNANRKKSKFSKMLNSVTVK